MKWISAKEKPLSGAEVLFTNGKKIMKGEYYNGEWGEGFSSTEYEDIIKSVHYEDVIAWMDLPDLPDKLSFC